MVQVQQSMRVLVVEDNIDIAENIADYLEAQGHVTDYAMDGIGGLHLALTQNFDVIVLDIMLPVMDGLTFCQKLRKEGRKQTPVLMLTARDTLDDKLAGFESGTDDYLVKPFALEELTARLQALVKRSVSYAPEILRVGDLELDTGGMKVRRAGQIIELNRVCMNILTMLMKAHPNVVTRKDIEHALWGDMPPGSDSIRSHVYALRQAIDKPFQTSMLETVHGIGYRLKENDEISA